MVLSTSCSICYYYYLFIYFSQSKDESAADVVDIPEELDRSADQPSQRRSQITEDIKSPSPSHDASVTEELSVLQSPTASGTQSFPTYGDSPDGADVSEREGKRAQSEDESDERVAPVKESPSASDSTVMKKLKKLRRHSSER